MRAEQRENAATIFSGVIRVAPLISVEESTVPCGIGKGPHSVRPFFVFDCGRVVVLDVQNVQNLLPVGEILALANEPAPGREGEYGNGKCRADFGPIERADTFLGEELPQLAAIEVGDGDRRAELQRCPRQNRHDEADERHHRVTERVVHRESKPPHVLGVFHGG